jgi:hypothetical protein
MSQKGRQMGPKNSQDSRNIYVLPFKTMVIMASWSFLIHINVEEFKTKNPFDKILSLTFGSRLLKVDTYCVKLNQFCKGLSKGSYNKKKLMGKIK